MNILKKIILKIGYNWLFLTLIVFLYLILSISNPTLTIASFDKFTALFLNIVPILVIVFAFLFAINLFLKNEIIIKYLGKESGIKGWLIAIGGGLISHGPIYMWYPLLSDLKEKGMKTSLVATFLYNRAVKIPLIPMMVFYFGWLFFIVLTVYMIIFSVINGLLVEKLVGGE